ncbi:phosphate transporter [Mangrovactinospora gilvigrisea]|uniref:Phosphate transporter n=1 Tax=Mangrovactinospora gilvigrisea TaxID=1428644 RepID=A0A1J7BRC7_9ACTN|nr:inorganic phosphate transporter [Mangrovactinospora gilvigrisea]OIV36001.1 phosphate transporter [Mangrovactinospora gilvigrisea]
MEHISALVLAVIITAMVFDFTNGFHDTANAMATTIATGALSPRVAVAVSAVLNLAGAFLSVEVAKTISGGIIDESSGLNPAVIFAGLVGAILWNLVTWLYGIPSSSSHALFGGLIGATVVGVGMHGVHFAAVVQKVVLPALAAPLVAGVAAALATKAAARITRRAEQDAPETARRGFRAGQIATGALVSLAHGTNDAQKTMGVITLTLIAAGALPHGATPPVWVIVSAGAAMALGTYCGGWRIIRTLGSGLTDISPKQGFAAQAAATAAILSSSHLGMALSTTHVCSGAVMGAGVGRSARSVRWNVAGRMAVSWVLTLPAAALVGGGAALVADRGTAGVAAVAAVGAAVAALVFVRSRRSRVGADNVNAVDLAAPAVAPAVAVPLAAEPPARAA